jgi:hypothetical protein
VAGQAPDGKNPSERTGLLSILYSLFGFGALVVFGALMFGTYIVGDSSYLLWRDAKVELWQGGAAEGAAWWHAIGAFIFLGASVACFAVVVGLHSATSRRQLVIRGGIATAVAIVLILVLSPASPYQR